jgi:hypothetical protein
LTRIHIPSGHISRLDKLRTTLLKTVFFVVLYEVIWVFVVPDPRHRFFRPAEWLGLGIIYGAVTYCWPTLRRDYDIELDDEEIRFLQNRSVKTVVRRNRIRYVAEWNGGKRLVISEHSPAWTRIIGPGISIPRTLPEYDQIKARALGWLQVPPSS